MSNFKVTTFVPSDNDVRKIGDDIVSIGGIFSRSEVVSVSGSGGDVTKTYVDSQDILSVTSGQQYTDNKLTVFSGNSKLYIDSQDTSISGYLQSEIDTLTSTIQGTLSYHNSINNEVEKLYTSYPDTILTTSGVNDLAIAISGLSDGQILEIRSNAVFNPIILPSGISFKIKVTDGYFPTISGIDCIKIANGASNIYISGLLIDTCSSSYSNGKGAAITFKDNHSKCSDIVFHNITIRNATGSAVMIGYYNDSDYATAPTLLQMSQRLAFLGCHIHKGSTDATEGGSITLRGCVNSYIADCYIDSVNLSRGIQLQNCIGSVVENCFINNCGGGGNGEGIKIDELGTISGYRNTAIIRNNIVKKCIEGIDIDDTSSINIIQNNIVSECSDEGISLDGGSPNGIAAIIGNICYKNTVGIRLESGSVANLKKNVCYNNTTNYLIQNGYSLDDSNTTSLDDLFNITFASLVKNDSIISGNTLKDVVETLNNTKQTISAGSTRPSSPVVGQMFLDTNLSPARPIWYTTTSGWVDSSGTSI